MRKLLSRHEISEIYHACHGYYSLFSARLHEYGYQTQQITNMFNELADGDYELPYPTNDEYQRLLNS